MPKTENQSTTVLVQALQACGIFYEVEDITNQTYDMLMWQTDCVNESFEAFAKKMARYIYIVRK